MEVFQPLPSEAAKRALYKVTNVQVDFKRGARKADQIAALQYLDELVEWWNMPSREWKPRKKYETTNRGR